MQNAFCNQTQHITYRKYLNLNECRWKNKKNPHFHINDVTFLFVVSFIVWGFRMIVKSNDLFTEKREYNHFFLFIAELQSISVKIEPSVSHFKYKNINKKWELQKEKKIENNDLLHLIFSLFCTKITFSYQIFLCQMQSIQFKWLSIKNEIYTFIFQYHTYLPLFSFSSNKQL